MADQLAIDSRSGLELGHLNVQSLWKKIDLIRMTFENSPFHVVGLSESWLTSNFTDPMVNISGFNVFRNDTKVLTGNDNVKTG